MLQCALPLDKHPAEFVNHVAAPNSALGRFGGSVLRSQQFGIVLRYTLIRMATDASAGGLVNAVRTEFQRVLERRP